MTLEHAIQRDLCLVKLCKVDIFRREAPQQSDRLAHIQAKRFKSNHLRLRTHISNKYAADKPKFIPPYAPNALPTYIPNHSTVAGVGEAGWIEI